MPLLSPGEERRKRNEPSLNPSLNAQAISKRCSATLPLSGTGCALPVLLKGRQDAQDLILP